MQIDDRILNMFACSTVKSVSMNNSLAIGFGHGKQETM